MISALLALVAVSPGVALGAADKGLAVTPPMGWNSWDSYGLTITEAQFRANMSVLNAQLKQFGWKYVVVDEGWYLENPEAAKHPETLKYTLNARGEYAPAENRFPSAADGAGFGPLADAVHEHGLKFGIHIIRGIPKQAVTANTRIGRTKYRASLAADQTDTCPWNPDNYGVKANAAGQAWYDALLKQYAGWGVDYLKVDCIASRPYKRDEIKMIHKAIRKTGRPIVLSLSPGPTALENAAEVSAYAQLWRISDDVWDKWEKGQDWSQSVKGQFPVLASWSEYVEPGSWPDADMLPLGQLGPVPGEGPPRATRLTEDEQRTMVTLWAIARSPLFLGANLTEMDGYLTSLVTNPDVIAVDQQSTENKLSGQQGDLVAWTAQSTAGPVQYLALFNIGDVPLVLNEDFGAYGVKGSERYKVRDLWQRKELGELAGVAITLPPHASILLALRPPD
ncbi:MAG TPA: glycoside hydrolase family 27 protein [Edaphobacter sp.]|nr:glycoside hydrolase family 27 protein [Edaphobacter sp.]